MEAAATVGNHTAGFPPQLGKRSAFPTAPTVLCDWSHTTMDADVYTLKPVTRWGPRGGMLLKSRGPMVLKTDSQLQNLPIAVLETLPACLREDLG